jgi:hypothetical protein
MKIDVPIGKLTRQKLSRFALACLNEILGLAAHEVNQKILFDLVVN